MKKKNKRAKKQLLLLMFLFVVFLGSVGMIVLGATIFRPQIPIFQLLAQSEAGGEIVGPKPPANPGVIDFETQRGMRLYMILGSDYRPGSGFRTDIIMLVAVDNRSGQVSMISFPRDLWVNIPGYGEQRINTVMQTGGFQLLANTMQTNFGVYPTHYAMIDMPGFLEVIDVLGGIEFETDTFTADSCDSSLNPTRWCEVGPGTVSLNSEWALWYVRARYNSSDFDRMRRSQEVVKAVFDKGLSPTGLVKMPELMQIYESEIQSNISPDQLLPMMRLGMSFGNSSEVRRFAIGPNETTGWTTSGGASVLLPNTTLIQAIIAEALTFD